MGNVIVGGRPMHIAKPTPRIPLSQQDVYAMLTDKTFNQEASEKAANARSLAAARAAKRRLADKIAAKQAEEKQRAAEEATHERERTRLLKLFGMDAVVDVAGRPVADAADAEVAAAGMLEQGCSSRHLSRAVVSS